VPITQFANSKGSGTYERSLNRHEFKLKKVLYYSKINKNSISGIKPVKEGLICKIAPRKDHVCLTLKYNNKKQKDKHLGLFQSDENNIIRIKIMNYSSIKASKMKK